LFAFPPILPSTFVPSPLMPDCLKEPAPVIPLCPVSPLRLLPSRMEFSSTCGKSNPRNLLLLFVPLKTPVLRPRFPCHWRSSRGPAFPFSLSLHWTVLDPGAVDDSFFLRKSNPSILSPPSFPVIAHLSPSHLLARFYFRFWGLRAVCL